MGSSYFGGVHHPYMTAGPPHPHHPHAGALYPVQHHPHVYNTQTKMSMVPSQVAQSEVFSASQYGGGGGMIKKRVRINYFILPVFIIEVVALACLWALFYYLRFEDVFPYHKRVFDCYDTTLSFPNWLPSDVLWRVYVSEALLYCLCFILPPFVIVVGEVMFWLFSTKPRKTVRANCYEFKVHLFTRRVCRFISVFMFGALIVCIFIDTIKIITGYQRPYFLKLCQVNYTACALPFRFSQQEAQATCLNRDSEWEYRIASTTFPSLYAGLSSYSAIFTSLYIFYMVSLRGAPLLRPFLIVGFIGMAIVASFSRIQGYKNHWRDIWVGWLIGAIIAWWLCYNVLCFQEVYHWVQEKIQYVEEPAQARVPPIMSWFKLPRVEAPSSLYTEESPEPPPVRHRSSRDANRTYEVTTTTESFQRTISPPNHVPNGYDY